MLKKIITSLALLHLILLANCSENPKKTTYPNKYIFRTIQVDQSNNPTEVSLIRQIAGEEKLVTRFFLDGSTIVSAASTPLTSDVVMPTGNFQTIGSGWSPITFLYLYGGELYLSSEGLPQNGIKGLTKIDLQKFIAFRTAHPAPYIYLYINPFTEFPLLQDTFETIAPLSSNTGIGMLNS